MLGGLDLGCPGIQEPGTGLMGSGYIKVGGTLDKINLQGWYDAFEKCGIDTSFYTSRERSYEEILPWDHINSGISKSFLMKENEKAKNAETTTHCRQQCAGCGSNKLNGGKCHALSENMV